MIDLYQHVVSPPRIQALGDISDFKPAAWESFLSWLKNQLQGSWNRAVQARALLKKVREDLNLPFIVDGPGEAGAPGAWNTDFDKNVLELQAIVVILTKAADEAIAGKRKLVFSPDQKDVGVELLPSDTFRVAINAQGRPVVVDVKSGDQVTQFEGTIGVAVPIIVAAIVVVGLVAYAVTEKICTTVENTARSKMIETIKIEGAKLIEGKKATPEQVTAWDKALLEGAASITKAEGAKAKEESQWSSTVRTVAWVGLGIAGIWLVGTLFGGRMGGGAGSLALARNPLSGGKVHLERVRLDRGGYDSRGRYWGAGAPLYRASSDEHDFDVYVRGYTRDEAKKAVREAARRSSRWPTGKAVEFYRAAA
jgi:hypothetical protein